MFTFLLVVHAIMAASLVAVILMQRSEGGGLGMGGGPSGLMTARGAADFLTRATTTLATLFVVMSIGLAALATISRGPSDIDSSLARHNGPLTPLGPALPAADPLAAAAAPGAGSQDATHVPTGPVTLPIPGPGSAPGVTASAPISVSTRKPVTASLKPVAAKKADSGATVKSAPSSAPPAPAQSLPIITPPAASPSPAPVTTPATGQ